MPTSPRQVVPYMHWNPFGEGGDGPRRVVAPYPRSQQKGGGGPAVVNCLLVLIASLSTRRAPDAPEPLTNPSKVISCTSLGGGRIRTAAGGVAAPWIAVVGPRSAPTGGPALAFVTGGASRSGRPGHPSPARDAVDLDLNPGLNFPGVAPAPLDPREHYDHRCPRRKVDVSHLTGAYHSDLPPRWVAKATASPG